LVWICGNKKPACVGRRRAGVSFQISLADLVQAMAVRRHRGPMMMVVTVMAVDLHLFKK
jgi:hypothetical protein